MFWWWAVLACIVGPFVVTRWPGRAPFVPTERCIAPAGIFSSGVTWLCERWAACAMMLLLRAQYSPREVFQACFRRCLDSLFDNKGADLKGCLPDNTKKAPNFLTSQALSQQNEIYLKRHPAGDILSLSRSQIQFSAKLKSKRPQICVFFFEADMRVYMFVLGWGANTNYALCVCSRYPPLKSDRHNKSAIYGPCSQLFLTLIHFSRAPTVFNQKLRARTTEIDANSSCWSTPRKIDWKSRLERCNWTSATYDVLILISLLCYAPRST